MKQLLIVLFLFTFGFSQTQIPETKAEIPEATLKSNTLIASVEGDLTKDGIPERVEVWRLNQHEEGEPDGVCGGELHIFRKIQGKWKLWHVSHSPIMISDGSEGSFQTIGIERGAIVISHYIGGTGQWEVTDRYRFQNGDWYQIGHTESSNWHGEFECYDYNFTTGKLKTTKCKIGSDTLTDSMSSFPVTKIIRMDDCTPDTGVKAP